MTPKKIGEGLKGPQIKLQKEDLFVQYDKNENVRLLLDPVPIKSFLEGKNSSVRSLLIVSRKVTVLMHGKFFHATLQMKFSY